MKTVSGIAAWMGVVLVIAAVSGCTAQDWSYIASGLDDANMGSPGYQPVCQWYDATDSSSGEHINVYYEGICNTAYLTINNTIDVGMDCHINFSGNTYQRRLPPYGKVELQQARTNRDSYSVDCEGQRY